MSKIMYYIKVLQIYLNFIVYSFGALEALIYKSTKYFKSKNRKK